MTSLLTSPTISLHFTHPTIFVHPSPDPTIPTHDPILNGTVTLYLPKARVLKDLRVRLKNVADVADGAPMDPTIHTFVLMQKELKICLKRESEGDDESSKKMNVGGSNNIEKSTSKKSNGDSNSSKKEVRLEKGSHTWEFSFIVPSSVAPYERCNYGRVYSRVYAKASFKGLTRSIDTSSKIDFIVNPVQEGETPGQFDLTINDFNQELGPFSLHFQSPHFAVAGILHISLNLPSPPIQTKVKLIKLEVLILQQFHLSRSCEDEKEDEKKSQITKPPSQRRRVLLLENLDVEGPWRLRRWVRLPNSNVLRPTTLSGTKTLIKCSHDLIFELTYRPIGSQAAKMLIVKKEISLISCLCMLDNVLTPPYVCSQDPHQSTRRRPSVMVGPLCLVSCFCEVDSEELLEGRGDVVNDDDDRDQTHLQDLERISQGRRRKWEWERTDSRESVVSILSVMSEGEGENEGEGDGDGDGDGIEVRQGEDDDGGTSKCRGGMVGAMEREDERIGGLKQRLSL